MPGSCFYALMLRTNQWQCSLFGLLLLCTIGCTAASPPLAKRSLQELQILSDQVDWSEALQSSIEVAAPVSELWSYVSDSNQAQDWSAYFHHIRTVPESPAPDGQPGSIRRCFRNAHERGPQWDELSVAVEPFKRRLILSFKFVGFKPKQLTRKSESLVEQRYESLGPQRSRLTFRTVPLPEQGWVNRVLYSLGAPETVRYFRINQENIRAAVEARFQKRLYQRVHPWESPPSSWGERFFTDSDAVH